MPTPKIESKHLSVGRREFRITFWKDRIQHPRLGRLRNGTVAAITDNDTGMTVACAYTLRNPADKNNPTYAKNTAFRRAVDHAFNGGKIKANTRTAMFKAFFKQEKAAV
jgi:hypothetical protein